MGQEVRKKDKGSGAVFVVVVAAGQGMRLGMGIPKAYCLLGGKTILEQTLDALCACDLIMPERIQVVIDAGHQALFDNLRYLPEGLRPFCIGGDTRAVSVQSGLQALNLSDDDCVLIHDAARPFVPQDLIVRLVDALAEHPAVIPTLPLPDALKYRETLADANREGYCLAQTPQGFRYHALRAMSDNTAHDEAALCSAAGIPLYRIAGSVENFKITYPDDLIRAEKNLSETIYSAGFDLHRMDIKSAPQDIAVGGILIPHRFGLIGHSDGDVVLHALVDAFLGGIAAGDIGQHFPPSDPQWKDCNSQNFLEYARNRLQQARVVIRHIDITIIADAPKIGPYRQAMQERLCVLLGLAPKQIAIKATTSEGLGFIDAREAIASQVTVTLRRCV